MLTHSPRAFPWERSLPWAHSTIKESTVVPPESAVRACGVVCARDVSEGTSRGVGTSATVRNRNASDRSVVGRRRGGRLSAVSPPRPKPATPKWNACAVYGPRPRLRPLLIQELCRRVVTQQRVFFAPSCDRPGCHEPPVTSVRNPARYCCAACRQAVRDVQDRERKWRSRGTLAGRRKRSYEYQAARGRRLLQRPNASAPSSQRAPPP
jgi:hypothetical protein